MPPKNGRGCRQKGHNFERETAEWFRRFFPEAKRGLGQARNAGEVADVEGTPYWVECKRGKVNITAALRQARTQTDGRTPLVVYKFDRERIGVAMDLDMFERLLRLIHPEVPQNPNADSAGDDEDCDANEGIER